MLFDRGEEGEEDMRVIIDYSGKYLIPKSQKTAAQKHNFTSLCMKQLLFVVFWYLICISAVAGNQRLVQTLIQGRR